MIGMYWCPIINDWTEPPIMKQDSRNPKSRKKTHVLSEGRALCGKRSPAWFHRPGDKPTCPTCLSQVTQS